MSALPYAICFAIEPLSFALRSSLLFKGISCSDIEMKLSLYADDLLLYVCNPFTALSIMLNKFGSFSGYKMNFQKSEYYPVNALALRLKNSDVPFRLSRSGLNILGLMSLRSLSSIFSANYTRLLAQTKSFKVGVIFPDP